MNADDEIVQYPKMVYPGVDKGARVLATPADGTGHGGVVVKNEDEEAWVMGGNSLDEYEPGKKAPVKAADGFTSNP
jgi:hypothetical protein